MFIRKDDGTPIRMPDSNRTYTLRQIDDNFPGLVGLHPLYVVRQLYDMQHGTRVGPIVALMQPVVSNLTIDDMINIAAYTASLDPGGPDLRPKRLSGATR